MTSRHEAHNFAASPITMGLESIDVNTRHGTAMYMATSMSAAVPDRLSLPNR